MMSLISRALSMLKRAVLPGALAQVPTEPTRTAASWSARFEAHLCRAIGRIPRLNEHLAAFHIAADGDDADAVSLSAQAALADLQYMTGELEVITAEYEPATASIARWLLVNRHLQSAFEMVVEAVAAEDAGLYHRGLDLYEDESTLEEWLALHREFVDATGFRCPP